MGLACAGLVLIPLAVVLPGTSAPATGRSAPQTAASDPAQRGRPTVVKVNANRRGPGASPLVLGSNHRFPFKGYGMWNTDTNSPARRVVKGARQAGISVLRYPGGSRANFFDWKEAIGPDKKRDCQVFGKLGAGRGVRAFYGVGEHMRFARRVGARTVLTMPFLTETPRDAAAWVEYMNDRVGGRNPNGGRPWASVRKQQGHPAPYNIHTWTLGNEPYLHNQRFWLGNDDATALRRYVNGARLRFTKQEVGSQCIFASGEARRPQQQREIKYPPVKPRSDKVFVKGERWKRVRSLKGYGAKAEVYRINNTTGKLSFGNGKHGKALPADPNVRASYTSVHAGYASMRRAMKKADHSIRVCSEWSKPQFVRYMGGRDYDCLAAHPYRIFNIHFGSPIDAHDEMIDAERAASSLVHKLRLALRRVHRGNLPVLVTEYGTISIPNQTKAPHWDLGMSDALFNASQVVGFVRRGVPLATGGALTSFNLRSTLGSKPKWTSSAWAVTSGQLSRVLGGTVIGTKVIRGPDRRGQGETYPALMTLAVRKGHRMHVVVINRHPSSAVTAELRVRRAKLAGKRIRIRTVVSRRASTFNSPKRPHAVHVVRGSKQIKGQSPELRYRAHSVSVLSFRIR